MSASFQLGFNSHGKGRVRFVKVVRNRDGSQDILQYQVQVMLEGDHMETAFTEGDNGNVVPTDTCKNTVYCVASQNNFNSIEEFGVHLTRHFLNQYPNIVRKVTATISRDVWRRLEVPDSNGNVVAHKHAFQRFGPMKPYTVVVAEKRRNSNIQFNVTSGFKNLEILKTTQSGFVGYPKDRYTTLPESTDRILGTSAEAEWTYNTTEVNRGTINYNKAFDDIVQAFVVTFTGPADTGIYSPSVQQTLYFMCCAALKGVRSLDEVSIYMPNIHNIPFNLEAHGFRNADHTGNPHIFYPIDEPHGMIKATVKRPGKAKL